jgi:hypothetical protein
VALARLVVRVRYHRPHSLRPRSSLQLGTESLIGRVFPESQSAHTIRGVSQVGGGCCIPERRFCSGKVRPLTFFLCPRERTVRNSTCCPGKGMLDSHRNNYFLGDFGDFETGKIACLRRWVVGNRGIHVGSGSLKTDSERFSWVTHGRISMGLPFCRPLNRHRHACGQFRTVSLHAVPHDKSRKRATRKSRTIKTRWSEVGRELRQLRSKKYLLLATTTSTVSHEKCQNLRKPRHPRPRVTFKSLGLIDPLLEALEQMKFKAPTDIQAEALPHALQGRDIIGVASTGSGKTAAFALPILQKLWEEPRGLFACVISPTRELAYQISQQFEALGSAMGVRCAVIVGGMDLMSQRVALAKKPHIVVATPGRLNDHLENTKGFSLRTLKFLVRKSAAGIIEAVLIIPALGA